jgi:hypothetical protein
MGESEAITPETENPKKMKSITITDEQAEVLASQDDSRIDPLMRDLRKQAQDIANETGKTCEIYHTEGYVIDARSPNA